MRHEFARRESETIWFAYRRSETRRLFAWARRLQNVSTTGEDPRGIPRTPADKSSFVTASVPKSYRQKSHAINHLANPLKRVRTPLPTPPTLSCNHKSF